MQSLNIWKQLVHPSLSIYCYCRGVNRENLILLFAKSAFHPILWTLLCLKKKIRKLSPNAVKASGFKRSSCNILFWLFLAVFQGLASHWISSEESELNPINCMKTRTEVSEDFIITLFEFVLLLLSGRSLVFSTAWGWLSWPGLLKRIIAPKDSPLWLCSP